jgi:methylmalonyl-CoA mutase
MVCKYTYRSGGIPSAFQFTINLAGLNLYINGKNQMASAQRIQSNDNIRLLKNLKNIIRDSSLIGRVKDRTGQLAETNGRRPRIILSSIGQNDRNRIIKMLATAFARWGFDVDVAPGNQTPQQAAQMAVENDVHIVCFLDGNGGNKKRASQLIDALKAHDGENILVAVCGTVAAKDHDFLYRIGVAGVLNFDQTFIAAVLQLLNRLK